MTSVTHTLVAIAVASKIQNPAIAFPTCFFSNYLLDMIPHWDFGYGWREKSKTKLFIEGLLDISVSYFLVFYLHQTIFQNTNIYYLLICAFLAQLPDWLEIPYLIFDFKKQPFSFFYQIQHQIHNRWNLPWGLLPQIVVAGSSLVWAIK
jgi:hypothetical protein